MYNTKPKNPTKHLKINQLISIFLTFRTPNSKNFSIPLPNKISRRENLEILKYFEVGCVFKRGEVTFVLHN